MDLRFPGLMIAVQMTLAPLASGQIPSFRLGDPPVDGHFTAYGAERNAGINGFPVATGDFDGDGFLDLALAPMRANIPDGDSTRTQAGKVYVYFGDGSFNGFVDFNNPPENTAFFLGAESNDIFGAEVWAGDVNGDGVDDLLIGAQDTDGPNGERPGAGSLYIAFGNPGMRGTFDMRTPPAFVTQIHGDSISTNPGTGVGDRLGIWFRAGDLNGDGIDDILVGADRADGPNNEHTNCGSAYILFGGEVWPATMDLRTPPPGRTVLFHGVDNHDLFGSTLNLGDVNGDGYSDVLISASLNRAGATLGSPGTAGPGSGGGDGPPGLFRSNAGETYIFFNPANDWPSEIDAANPPISVSMTVVYGHTAGDSMGEEVLSLDLAADGADELILGALTRAPLGRSTAGSGYILPGGPHLENRQIDLASPPLDLSITEIYGIASGDIAADTMVPGDVDNDGFPDLVIGSPNHDLPGGNNEGRIDILFGREAPFPPVIDLANPPVDVRMVAAFGPQPGDVLAYSMTIGDWNDDGYADPMPNGMTADGFENQFLNTGDGYIIDGRVLAALAPPPTPTPTPEPTRSADFDHSGKVDAADLFLLLEGMQ